MGDPLQDRRFERFFRESYAPMVGILRASLGPNGQAEDAVQEAVARAWRRREEIQDLDAWVYTTAINVTRKRWRRQWRELLVRQPLDGVQLDATPFSVDIRRVVAALPERQRQVILLFYVMDFSVSQIAELTATSPGAVKNALHKGRQSMKLQNSGRNDATDRSA